jgi:hypothetical protein
MPSLTVKGKAACPFAFHGVLLEQTSSDKDRVGECPFCGKVKLYVTRDHLWKCMVCGAQGNLLSFLRKLWEESDKNTTDYQELLQLRGLLEETTPMAWGVCRSITTGDWVVPAFNPAGKLMQLHRWIDQRRLLPTPGLKLQLFGANLWKQKAKAGYVCEGPWDGMILWETLRATKATSEGFQGTAAEAASLLADAFVVGVPGANTFKEEWGEMFRGKAALLMYDSDHPKLHCRRCKKAHSLVEHSACPACRGPLEGPVVPPSGFAGVRLASRALEAAGASVKFLRWGKDGYDSLLPSGTDLRDRLSLAPEDRVLELERLLGLLAEVPSGERKPKVSSAAPKIQGVECSRWELLESSWRKALCWRWELSYVLSVMLAVVASTAQVGDQLFLQVIGDAGSGKTRFCDGLLVSSKCYALEHLTGFHSGWKDPSGEDYSLLARINYKTLVTPEGDVLMSSPRFAEIMSQQRRIFDGTSGASYKNRREDLRYTGLRTPWIIAGTPALLDTDQARLGDRFLRVIIRQPDDAGRDQILKRVGHAALRSVTQTSNGKVESTVEERMLEAYQLTGGYVDWLRENAEDQLRRVVEASDQDALVARCQELAEFAAFLRARPSVDKRRDEVHNTKELPTRLTHQFVRLACCLAVVLNRERIDEEVMARVHRVAMDTASGKTLDLIKCLHRHPEGLTSQAVAISLGLAEEKGRGLLGFLRTIGAVEGKRVKDRALGNRFLWNLRRHVLELCNRVLESKE